jgi:hypothetical protein
VTWDLEVEEKELVIPDAHKQAICFSNYVRVCFSFAFVFSSVKFDNN